MRTDILIVLCILAGLIFIQVMLLGYLAFRKMNRAKRERLAKIRYDQLMEHTIQSLFDTATPVDLDLLKEDPTITGKVLCDLLIQLQDQESTEKIQKLAEETLTAAYSKDLVSRSWAVRMNGMYFIQRLSLKKFQDVMLKRFHELAAWDEEKQQVAKTLASFGEIYILDEAFTGSMSAKLHRDLLWRFPESAWDALNHYYQTTEQPSFRSSYIRFIGDTGQADHVNLLEEALGNEHQEVRLAALRALGNIYHLPHPELLTPFFSSVEWQERLLATKLVGRLKLAEYAPELKILLGDLEWWVRYAAAESILAVEHSQALAQYAATHEDPYARNMAAQWVSLGVQKGVAHE